MRLPPDIAHSVAVAAQAWAESTSDLPLIIRKDVTGAVCVQALPRQRWNKGAVASELNMSRNTFAKVEERFGLAPSPSDGCYDRETVEDLKRWMRAEETRSHAPKPQRIPV